MALRQSVQVQQSSAAWKSDLSAVSVEPWLTMSFWGGSGCGSDAKLTPLPPIGLGGQVRLSPIVALQHDRGFWYQIANLVSEQQLGVEHQPLDVVLDAAQLARGRAIRSA